MRYALCSATLARISATTSPFGFVPSGPQAQLRAHDLRTRSRFIGVERRGGEIRVHARPDKVSEVMAWKLILRLLRTE